MTVNEALSLDAESSKYLTRVLRMQAGDPVILFNGDGNDYHSVIGTVGRNVSVEISTQQRNPSESTLKITLVQSLAKGTKLDLIIQKATELGAHRISPISNERSILRIDTDRTKRKMDHWRNVAISACAQCNRSVIPQIDSPMSFADWLALSEPENTFLLHPHTDRSFGDVTVTQSRCSVVVGPEGGFSEAEFAQSVEHGITPVRCGPRILRTETAGFTAISILQARFGDLH